MSDTVCDDQPRPVGQELWDHTELLDRAVRSSGVWRGKGAISSTRGRVMWTCFGRAAIPAPGSGPTRADGPSSVPGISWGLFCGGRSPAYWGLCWRYLMSLFACYLDL